MSAQFWQSLETALSQLIGSPRPAPTSEFCTLEQLRGRVAAIDIHAPVAVPPMAVSAMDGYGLALTHALPKGPWPVVETVLAGADVSNLSVAPGQAVRIMTGAPIPDGVTAVVMQENTTPCEQGVRVATPPEAGENIRPKGNDIAQSDLVIPQNTRLQACHIMLLASLGLTGCEVYRKLKVAVAATGDEVVAPGQPLRSGQIYNSNSVGIAALLAPFEIALTDLGICPDDPQQLRALLTQATEHYDLLITSGGVSVGEADYLTDILADLGQIAFWKVAIKPGKPFAFGKLGNCLFCGLPGNPVSSYVTTEQLVIPLIEHLQYQTPAPRLTLTAHLTHDWSRRPGRKEFVRACYSQNSAGQAHVSILPRQSSGVMTTVTQANCYVVVDTDCAKLAAGQQVTVQPFAIPTAPVRSFECL